MGRSILFVAGEGLPFVKTGGLADVIGALPKALVQKGHDARVVLPLYSKIIEKHYDKLERLGQILQESVDAQEIAGGNLLVMNQGKEIYYAQAGEEVFAVARRFHVAPAQILAANQLEEELSSLPQAQRLLIPVT